MKKILYQGYNGYKGSYKGVEYIVFKSYSGYSKHSVVWNMVFDKSFNVNERDSSMEFRTKQNCNESAIELIEKTINPF